MTGRHLTTTSPSSVNSRRSTPCVDGCWGPMLIVSSSRGSAASVVVAIDLSRYRKVDRLRAERLCSPQRVALPVVGQHDAAQLRVALEFDAEQVVQLAFEPVRAGYQRGDARRFAIGAGLEAQPGAQLH